VNAPGTLEPEYVRNVTALTTGRVEELPIKPGVPVQQGTMLVVMSNPDEDIRLLQNEQSLNSAVAGLASLKTTLHQQLLSQQGQVATMHTQYNNAARTAAVQDSLAKRNLSSANDVAAAHDAVGELKQRLDLEEKRLADIVGSEQQQIQLQQDQVASLKRIVDEQKKRVAAMRVVAPEAGQL
jgi:multidrug resistance efflux pump